MIYDKLPKMSNSFEMACHAMDILHDLGLRSDNQSPAVFLIDIYIQAIKL